VVVVFRCDAGQQIGSGHVMRCQTLAKQLRRRGATPLFVCRQQPGDLLALTAQDFRCLVLPPLADPQGWLGCDQQRDADETLAAIDQAAPESIQWLVVDHYGLDALWHRAVRDQLRAWGHQPRLLVIDDLADRPLMADLLLDQNRLDPGAAMQSYAPLVSEPCRFLLGPAYALLSDEYPLLQRLLPERQGPLQRILLFFGGSDPANLSERCLDGLLHPTPLPLQLDLVLGLANPHRDRIKARLADCPQVRLHQPMSSLAGLMVQADLALGAGGVSSWERACLGLPTLVSSLAANQDAVIAQLAQAGAAIDLGPADQLTASAVRRAVESLLQRPEQWQSLSHRARGLTDGFGAARTAAAMLGPCPQLHLRSATPADEALWLRWANDPACRAASFNGDWIQLEAHHRWFTAKLADPRSLLLIGEDPQGLPIGYVRFESIEGVIVMQQRLVSLALEPVVRGHGLAVPLLQQAIAVLCQRTQQPWELLAEIKPENQASIRLFEAAGFLRGQPRRPGALCFSKITA